MKCQLISYLQREDISKVDLPVRGVLVCPGWKVDYTDALGSGAEVQVSASTALINRIVKFHSSSSKEQESTADRIDQLLGTKNIVRLEKF